MINGHRYWVFAGQYLLVLNGTVSAWGDTGCNLVVLGQYNLVLIGSEWYWVNKGLLCLYISRKKLMVTSTDRPTNQPTDRPTKRANIEQSAFSNVRK